MKREVYERSTIADDFSVFEFYSEGPKGSILKRAAFFETNVENVCSLEFGCVNEDNEIDVTTISDNNDRDIILATLASIIKQYTSKYPHRWIEFSGSTPSRTRLYRMAIGLNLEELSKEFLIFGLSGGQLIPFSKNMKASRFIVKRKK